MSFFRSIMRARPIGLHRHFHALSMRTAIHQDTGRYVSIDDIWEKLRGCYNVDALESLVCLFSTRKLNSAFCDSLTPPIFFIIGRRGIRIARVCAFHTERRRLTLPLRQPLSAPIFPQGVRPSVRRSAGLHHLQPSRARLGVLDLLVPFATPTTPRQRRAAGEAAREGRWRAPPQPHTRER